MDRRTPLVVHVIHHLVIGGLENGLVNLINRMPPERYRHLVLCMEDYSDFRHRIARPEVEVLALRKSQKSRTRVFADILGLFRERRPAIVHSRNLSGLDALLPALLAGVAVRMHGEHGWATDDVDGNRLKPLLLRRLHRPLVHQYVAVSRDLQTYLTRNIGVPSARVRQIYNGVDVDRFKSDGEAPEGMLPPSFRGSEKVVIGTVGRLQPIKNQVALIRAFAKLLGGNPALRSTARLAIVGGGPLRDALVDAACQSGVGDFIWMSDAQSDVASVLRCMDIFVLPSINEGLSNTILEAMASGLPVIASNVGGNPELVVNGVTGALYDPRSEGLERALATYVAEPEIRHAHGAAGRARAVRVFALDAMVRQYMDLYDELLAPPPAPSGKWPM